MLCVCVCVHAHSVAQLCPTLGPHGLQPARLLCPWNFQSKNTGVNCYFPLQSIFLTQGSNLCLLSPALAGGFFTTAPSGKPHVLSSGDDTGKCWHGSHKKLHRAVLIQQSGSLPIHRKALNHCRFRIALRILRQ